MVLIGVFTITLAGGQKAFPQKTFAFTSGESRFFHADYIHDTATRAFCHQLLNKIVDGPKIKVINTKIHATKNQAMITIDFSLFYDKPCIVKVFFMDSKDSDSPLIIREEYNRRFGPTFMKGNDNNTIFLSLKKYFLLL